MEDVEKNLAQVKKHVSELIDGVDFDDEFDDVFMALLNAILARWQEHNNNFKNKREKFILFFIKLFWTFSDKFKGDH